MKKLDDKASVMMLLREATEQSLKLEAMSLITSSCSSSADLDWGDLRRSLEILLGEAGKQEVAENLTLTFVLCLVLHIWCPKPVADFRLR